MPLKRWPQVKDIVNACVDLEPDQRGAYIQEACYGDATLCHDVTSLLAAYDELGDFLETPVLESEREELPPGSRIGSYEIREPLAEGGMGTVYRAVRTSDFEKQVAVKVVKRGMDTKFILRRFRHERQILAALDHPNIASLLDGGATGDGRPYLVMEYIEGRPITAYAEERGLSLSERLHLFRMVCSAVQYAHQNLVVHRDLKPGNILVTAAGVPKLLDFGIARLLESDVDMTMASMRLMTPECASPEQVRGEPITTATDIYSLGVLLYELLTGARPYQFTARTPEEIRRVVCETDPKKPSAVERLSEDLDHIVLKAMHKDPARRYVSAEQVSEDLGRYLQGLPVSARGDSTWYRARKFVTRHRTASLAGAALALSLVGGMGATLWEARVARSASARAERRLNDVRELANSLIFDVHDAVSTLPGATAARKLIVDRALKYLDRVAIEAADDDSLRRELAAGYLRLGEVQGKSGRSNLGDFGAAIQSFRKAIKLLELLQAGRSTPADQRLLAGAYDNLAYVQWDAGDPAGASESDRKALALRQALAGRVSPLELNKELSLSYHSIGLHRGLAGDYTGALESYQKFLEARERIARADPKSASNQRNLSLAHKRVGAVLIVTGHLSDALAHYQAAEAIDEKRVAAGPNNAEARMDLTFAYSDIGDILRKQGQGRAALAQYQKVEAIRTQLAAADPNDQRAQSSLSSTYEHIAGVQWDLGDRRTSLAYHQKALVLVERLLAANPDSAAHRTEVATVSVAIGNIYAAMAAQRNGPSTSQLVLLQQARDYYQRTQQMVAALKAAGVPDSDAAEASRQATRQLVRCDAAIARLSASGVRTPLSAELTR